MHWRDLHSNSMAGHRAGTGDPPVPSLRPWPQPLRPRGGPEPAPRQHRVPAPHRCSPWVCTPLLGHDHLPKPAGRPPSKHPPSPPSPPRQAKLPAPCGAEPGHWPGASAGSVATRFSTTARLGWACDGQGLRKTQELGKEGAHGPGAAGRGRLPDPGRERGEAPQRPLRTGTLRGPTGKPLTARYLQPDPAPGPWFPPCFLLPHRPAAPTNRNSPRSKAGKHKQISAGLRDAGRRQGQTPRSGLRGSGTGGRGQAGPRRVPQEGRGEAETASRSPGTKEGRVG